MDYDVIIIGGGASGLMAAIGAAESHVRTLVVEKMPRPGRKIMITGKGRCNFTNMKDWNLFSPHIRVNSNVLRPAFYCLTPQRLTEIFAGYGLESVTERGDRVFPASYRAMDVVDTLVRAAKHAGAQIRTGSEVQAITAEDESCNRSFSVRTSDGQTFRSSKIIVATGGLSYPSTGSTGDGYRFAIQFGHSLKTCFPSLTALVPKGYKETTPNLPTPQMKGHVDRATRMSGMGQLLCSNSLKNIGLHLLVNNSEVQAMEGDIDFTDCGLEGPAGFAISRNAVKAIMNGSKVKVFVDMKPAVTEAEFFRRIDRLRHEIISDPRSHGKPASQMIKILLEKLMPRGIIQGFMKCHPEVAIASNGVDTLDIKTIVKAIKHWEFEIAGFVGYERCVITAGGIAADEVVPKTLESRKCHGLYLCGEVLDIDADTGGYNLHIAFSTGHLAGLSAAKACLEQNQCMSSKSERSEATIDRALRDGRIHR